MKNLLILPVALEISVYTFCELVATWKLSALTVSYRVGFVLFESLHIMKSKLTISIGSALSVKDPTESEETSEYVSFATKITNMFWWLLVMWSN